MLINILRHIKRIINTARGLDCFFTPDVLLPTLRLGSRHGGWEILEALVEHDDIIYSAGIGTDISFDLEMIEQFSVKINAFDPTPESTNWLQKQILPPNFTYYPWGVAGRDATVSFHIPKNPNYVSHSILRSHTTRDAAIEVPVKRIQTIMRKLGHDHVDILKMDIEGAEYEVIDDLLSSNLQPKMLLIEFHHRFRTLGNRPTKKAVQSLKESGYRLYSISPSGEELCFAHEACLVNLEHQAERESIDH